MNTTRFPFVFGDTAVLITAKKCQTLDEYCEKTVKGAMGCDVLETNYIITILQYDDTFFLVENSIVSEQEMIDYAHRKS